MNNTSYSQTETLTTEALEPVETDAYVDAIRELASIELAYVGGGTGMVSFT